MEKSSAKNEKKISEFRGKKRQTKGTSQRGLQKKLKPTRRLHLDSEESNSETEPNLPESDSDFELPIGKKKPEDEDATCIFCESKFSNDTKGELWVQCVMCSMWAHNECSGAEKDIYVCDFCK